MRERDRARAREKRDLGLHPVKFEAFNRWKVLIKIIINGQYLRLEQTDMKKELLASLVHDIKI